jgi:hypothetical protein
MRNLRASGPLGTLIFALGCLGCQIPRALTGEDLDARDPMVHVRTVTLVNGSEVDFRSDSLGYGVTQDSVIAWKGNDGRARSVPLDSVARTGGTRYPTSSENATQNLVVAGSLIAVILWIALNPIKVIM